MAISKATSAPLPFFMTLIGVCLLLGLGTWQVHRLIWKTGLIHQIESQQNLSPVSLSETPAISLYRPVTVTGRFLHNTEFHLYTGPHHMGGKPGYNIITPLEYENGKIVMVNRGWVEETKKNSSARPETLTPGDVTLEGILVPAETKRVFTPENDIPHNVWLWVDRDAMSESLGKPVFPDIFLSRRQLGYSLAYPVPAPFALSIRNDHLQYAITWYSLGIALIVIYILYRRKQKHEALQ